MIPYLAIAVALLALALAQTRKPSQVWGSLALSTVAAFGALRFRTGFDWLPYTRAFEAVPPLGDAMRNGIPTTDPPMEPLYLWLTVALKTVTANPAALFASATLFGLILVHTVAGKISRTQCSVWLVYFGLLFLPVQMSAVRSGIASSCSQRT